MAEWPVEEEGTAPTEPEPAEVPPEDVEYDELHGVWRPVSS